MSEVSVPPAESESVASESVTSEQNETPEQQANNSSIEEAILVVESDSPADLSAVTPQLVAIRPSQRCRPRVKRWRIQPV